MTNDLNHWHTVQDMLRGYRPAQILITCAQLDLFNHLAAGPKNAADLANLTGTNPQALERLLNAAAAHNLLTRQDSHFANTPLAETCLVEGGRYHLGNLIRREGAFFQRWSYLPEAVRSGWRPEANIRDEGQRNWVLDFELALYDLALAYGPAIAEALALPEDQPIRVLDVGGGHGGYSMALARRYPNVHPTVYELPAAAAVARDIIAGEGMSGRVSVQEGDFQKEPLGSGYDLLLLFGVLVSETPPAKLELLRKAHDALVPGGRIAIRGFWLNEDRAGPPQETIFSLHMLLSTDAGDISTRSEMEELVRQAGFDALRPVALPGWDNAQIDVADKKHASST